MTSAPNSTGNPSAPTPVQMPLSPSDERTWAMLAHLSVLLNLATGILGPVGALIIYLVYKDRSRYVAYQSLQSLIFQLIGWVGGGIIIATVWTITGILSAIIVGVCLIPFAIILSIIPLGVIVYCIIGAIKCSNGEDFKYWLVGDWVRSTYTG
jgi:uncharacterized protein